MVCYHFVLSLRWKSLDHENVDVKNLVQRLKIQERKDIIKNMVNTETVREETRVALKELGLEKNMATFNTTNIAKRWKQEWIEIRLCYRMCNIKLQEYPFEEESKVTF